MRRMRGRETQDESRWGEERGGKKERRGEGKEEERRRGESEERARRREDEDAMRMQ